MNEEEMHDVNGGKKVYISHGAIVDLFFQMFAMFSLSYIVGIISAVKVTVAAFVSGIGGWIGAGIGFAIAAYTKAWDLALTLGECLTSGLGLEISISTRKYFGVTFPAGINYTAK